MLLLYSSCPNRRPWSAMDVSDTSFTLASSDLDEHDRNNIWNPMLDLRCHVHNVSACRHCSTKEFWEETHFLVTLHLTFYATKNECTTAEKRHPLLMSQPETTKRERQGSITIDHTVTESCPTGREQVIHGQDRSFCSR